MHLSGLFIYPVKALRGISLREARVDALGLEGDRRFLVVDPSGRFLTQRTHPRMALVDTALSAEELILSAAGAGSVRVSRQADPSAPLLSVSVWKSEGLLAEDCGAEPASWLQNFLGVECRLVRIGSSFTRPIPEKKIPAPLLGSPQAVSFADAFPFLIIGEASLSDLNARLQAKGSPALPMNRFRPNLVVSGSEPYAEDRWPRFRIGELAFQAGGPCARCPVTTTDQETAERAAEPLRTLGEYRRDPQKPGEVLFGQNLIHETKTGILRLGDRVEI